MLDPDLVVVVVVLLLLLLLLSIIHLPRWPSGKASASRAEDPGFDSRLRRDYFRGRVIGDLKIGTPVATLPGAWRYWVRAGTGSPDVSIL